MHTKLIARINRKYWWRTALPSKRCILDRGLFFASSFEEAEFYGRPLDTPFRVRITNPIVGSFFYIEKELLGYDSPGKKTIAAIFDHDALLKKRAENKGFDSIIVLSSTGHDKYYHENKIPYSVELNWFAKLDQIKTYDLIAKKYRYYFD